MTMIQILLASRPLAMPTKEMFRPENIDLAKLKEGKMLLKGLYSPVDPYMILVTGYGIY